MTKTAADIYRYKFDPNSDVAAANVLRFVGHNRDVLEIGAGPGSISRPLVEVNGCRLTAVEIDPASGEILQQFCELVIPLDLNDPSWPEALGARRFDNVVIADVLEHLYDPWGNLSRAAKLLNDKGSVIVSLPHAGHATVLGCLLGNDFEYRDSGLLDRTHIRFFGMRNIQDLFEGAELKIIDFAYVILKPEETEFASRWADLPSWTKPALESGDFSDVYQVVIRAEPIDRRPATQGKRLLDHAAPRAHKLKYVAFYLPQFYPIPENDAWWGKGFTEWTNTIKARPLFPGHYQPHVPADLGYYDLRERDVQRKQIAIAKQYGIDAFCFHYYWFNGRRLLDKPVDEFLSDEKADIEFCLCWANENWTRKWDASEHEILIAQDYSPTSDIKFIESLIPYFQDRRYLRVGGAPVLVVYRPQHMPNARETASRWRDYCRAHGIGEIHLVAALTHGNRDFEQFGYDAGVEFPPHNVQVRNLADKILSETPPSYVVAYGDVTSQFIACDYTKRRVYRTVFPSWDNTARVQERALVVLDGTPENYKRWLYASSCKTVDERLPNDRLLFINAWNEWAEGCHLEPDQRYGRGFLEATLQVKTEKSYINSTKHQNVEELLREATELKKKPKPLRRAKAFGLFLRAGRLLRASQREHEVILRKVRDSGLFDAKYYLEHNEDVRVSGVDPLSHFIEHGVYELRNPSHFFDVKLYLLSNPDVRAARVNPLLHYIEHGQKEGRRPHPER